MKASWFEELQNSALGSVDYEYEKIVLDFTETIIKVMKRKGWNRVEFARKLSVKPSYITKLLKGSNLTMKQMLRVCKVLGCNLEINIDATESIKRGKIINWTDAIQRRKSICGLSNFIPSISAYNKIKDIGVKVDVIAS